MTEHCIVAGRIRQPGTPDDSDYFLEQVLHQPIANVDLDGHEQILLHESVLNKVSRYHPTDDSIAAMLLFSRCIASPDSNSR